MRIVLFAVMVFVATLSSSPAFSSDNLDTIIDEYWEWTLKENPFDATYLGDERYNDKVPDVSPAAHAERLMQTKLLLDRLQRLEKRDLDRTDQTNAALLEFILKHEVELGAVNRWQVPFLADSGFHTSLARLPGAAKINTDEGYRDYIDRLEALPRYIDQQIANMEAGLETGFTQPKAIIGKILPSFETMATTPLEDHPLYSPFKMVDDHLPARKAKKRKEEARAVMAEAVLPAFNKLNVFMREQYAPRARSTLGISSVPGGVAYYDALTRFYTTLDEATPEEVHQVGLKEVDRIRAEMMEIIKEVEFEGSFAEFLDYLRTDEQFYARSPRELLERAAWISKDIDGRLPAYFEILPRQPYSVEPVPEELAPNYTNARYSGAALGAARGGQFWVNTYNFEIRPLYQLTAMALHEAVPGHHLQIALALEMEDVPAFRNEFYPHAFGEGWALYAEKLGVEMGVYETPYDDFGRLTWEMWRACRLVIDTGIHAKGWTREQAVDYLASNTALSLHNVETEIDRYISWPGQALAYKMGELTIWELRAKAEKELGDQFDIRTFHNAILDEGGLPLEMLRVKIDRYIDDNK